MKYYLALILLVAIFVACTKEIPVEQETSFSDANVTIIGNTSTSVGRIFQVNIQTDQTIRVPQATYWTKAGPWQIFKLEGNDWDEIEFFNTCFNSCEDVCYEEKVCTPGGPYPSCNRIKSLSGTILIWDLTYLTDDVILCDEGVIECKKPELITPGTYKIVFSYRDDCAPGMSWTLEESEIFTKELIFEVE